MKTTIETIDGCKCTVIWMDSAYEDCLVYTNADGCIRMYDINTGVHVCTALPALPRNPTADDAPLLYRYAAEGVNAFVELVDENDELTWMSAVDAIKRYNSDSALTTIHATDAQGKPVEAAIDD